MAKYTAKTTKTTKKAESTQEKSQVYIISHFQAFLKIFDLVWDVFLW